MFSLQSLPGTLSTLCFAALAVTLVSPPAAAADLTLVGMARVDISPEQPVPLMGYAARAKVPATLDIAQRLHARALAIGEGEAAAVLLTIDNCILPRAVTEELRRRLREKANVPAERVTLSVTHTHSAPWLTGAAPNIFGRDTTPAEQSAIDTYTQSLIAKLEEVALAALADRKPAAVSWGKGSVGFARNRRTPDGPVDHDLPLLRVSSPEGMLRAVLVSYACHCTTLDGSFNAVHGDWAGVAAEAIEREHPGATALVSIGCGADANPHPRGKLELAVQHGEELAREARRLLGADLKPITGAPECRVKTVELPFQKHFSREEWERRAAAEGVVGYHARKWISRLERGETLPAGLPYPVQTWRFGDQLAMVFLPGEVVVDYSLRLKRELDSQRLWLNAYCNEVPCYIPSRRILSEGGYEAESSLWYYDRPQRLAPEAEDLIVQTVRELLPPTFAAPEAAKTPPPQSPAEARKTFRLREGFKVELVASEPLIESPVAIDFGADGRLWVCEMRDYPNGMDGNGQPGGRIKVLSDTDSDGQFDSAEVWADDLPFPTGLMAWRDGVLVCAAPDVWLITPASDQASERAAETKGAPPRQQRRATRRETLLTGFVTENFQARVNGLRWGLDGWVHGSGGLFGGKITVLKTGQTIDCTNRDFRFRPDTGEFEPLAGVSQQGHVRDDFDQWFGNDSTTLLWHFPMPDRYRRRNPHVTTPPARVFRSRDADPGRVFPASATLARFNHPESANRITSGCGPEIYRDDLFGSEFDGNAFGCESVHNLVRRAVLAPDGVSFAHRRAEGEESSEFIASTDHWFRPVETRTGPDGALWIVDMYRFVIEHPRWIPAEQLKELDVRAGADRGRLWRVLPKGAQARRSRNLTEFSARDLAEVIGSPNGPTRDLAHRLLLDVPAEEFAGQAAPALRALASHGSAAAGRAQALAVLRQCNQLDQPLLAAALADPDARVRRFATTLSEPHERAPFVQSKAEPPVALLRCLNDPDAAVRFQLALSLGAFAHDKFGSALAELALKDGGSEWHRAAILSSLLAAPGAFVRHFAARDCEGAPLDELRNSILSTLVSAERPEALAHWISARFPAAAEVDDEKLAEALHLLVALAAHRQVEEQLAKDAVSPAAASIARLHAQVRDVAGQIIRDEKRTPAARKAALQLLAESAAEDHTRRFDLLSLLQANLPHELHPVLTAALQRQEAPEFGIEMLNSWSERTPRERFTLLPVLLSREEWSAALLAAVERRVVSTAEFSATQRQQLLMHRNASSRAKAEKYLSAEVTDRAPVLQRFSRVSSLSGDAKKGGARFEQICASCHSLHGVGHAVGPDLGPFREKSDGDFLAAILDPNAAVEPRYAMWNAEMNDGRLLAGVVSDESTASLTLSLPGGGRDTLPRKEIKRLEAAPVSLMPVGLEHGLEVQDMADLIAWIRKPQ